MAVVKADSSRVAIADQVNYCETLRWFSNTDIAVDLLIMFTYKFARIANVVTLIYSFIINYIKRL